MDPTINYQIQGFYIIALIAAPLIAAQDIECYKCKGDHKDDSCFDTDFLINGSGNETMSEKCNEGCMIQTRIGKKNGDRFDEIERGCIPKLEHTVGCDTDSKDVSTIVYETH